MLMFVQARNMEIQSPIAIYESHTLSPVSFQVSCCMTNTTISSLQDLQSRVIRRLDWDGKRKNREVFGILLVSDYYSQELVSPVKNR